MSQLLAKASRATFQLHCGASQFATKFTKTLCSRSPDAASGSTFWGKLHFHSTHELVSTTAMEKYGTADKSQSDVPSLPWLGAPSPAIEECCKTFERFNAQSVPRPRSDLPLPWIGGVLDCHGDNMTGGPTDYELDLGKITDTLQTDYSAFFEREPNFEIYDDSIKLEFGQPLQTLAPLHGKRSYCRAFRALQGIACRTIRDGTVQCRIYDGAPCGHALRLYWTCQGNMLGLGAPIYVSAISLYSIARQVQKAESKPYLSHKINHHVIDFVEIHPPSLRSFLFTSLVAQDTDYAGQAT